MSSRNTESIQLDIYSDLICPWCYVGKARLDAALETLGPSKKIKIQWKPFQLNPNMPTEGMERSQYMLKKFGTSDVSAMQARLSAAGAENGLVFNFASMKRVPNTFSAHRLLWFALNHDKQHALSAVLFRKYFHDGLDIGETETLVDAATEAGLDATAARNFLVGKDGCESVEKEEKEGRLLGINAVPTFIVNGDIIATGAIPVAELVCAIEAAATVTK